MPSLERYLSSTTATNPTFSADGRYLVFISNITGVPQLWRVEIADQILWPEQLTFGEDRVMYAACSPVDNRIVFGRDAGGNENMQLFLLDPDTGEEYPLTAGHKDAMHLPGAWSADGRQITFAANRWRKGLFDIYVQAIDSDDEAEMIWHSESPGFPYFSQFTPDGGRVAFSRVNSTFNHDLVEVEVSSGIFRVFADFEHDIRYGGLAYSKDGTMLYVLTDEDSDFLYLAQINRETDEMTVLAAPEWDVELLCLSPDGRLLAYVVNVEGSSELYLYDLETMTSHRALGVEGVISALAFRPDCSGLAYVQNVATRNNSIYLWDLQQPAATAAIRPLTRAAHGGIPLESFVAPELIHYPTFDTEADGTPRQIPAWLYRPPGKTADIPVIVYVHGGPASQFRPEFFDWMQYFVHNGYAILAPNVRGSTGYGRRYTAMDDVEKRMDSVKDLAYAAQWIKAQPEFDGARIVVYGRSYGGFMVLSALTTYPDLWVAGVEFVGISNWVTFLENTSGYRRAHREAEYGSVIRDRALLMQMSPIHHVDNIRVPLLIFHGANDPRVPLSETQQMVKAIKTPVEFVVFDDEGHQFVKRKTHLVVYPTVLRFLEKYVNPS